jgi:amino acid transporter
MSTAGVLPRRLGDVHHRHLSPHTSSLVQTATAVVFIAAFAILGLDPVLAVFTWFSGVATLAIAILMAITSVAVIVYFTRKRRGVASLWHTVIAPVLGLVGLVGSSVIITAYFPMLVGDVDAEGVPVFGALSLSLIAVILLTPVAGYVQALVLRTRDPKAYERITEAIGG